MDLKPFLASPQMQMAWFTQLSVTKGEDAARDFKNLIVSLQQSSELLTSIENQLKLKKMAKSGRQIPITNTKPVTTQPPASHKSWLDESQRPYLSPSSILMPSATSADAFYTLANAAVRQQHLQVI